MSAWVLSTYFFPQLEDIQLVTLHWQRDREMSIPANITFIEEKASRIQNAMKDVMISTSHLHVNSFWFSQCCIVGNSCEQLENPELWAAYLQTHKLRSFAMNLIKVLLGNLASTQLYAMSQGNYSYPGFELLPNHVKNYREVKFCFSRCSQECQQVSLFVALMNSRPEARPETSRRCYLWQFSHVNPTEPLLDSRHVKREAVCTTILMQQLTDEKWPQTGHQQSINVSLTFEHAVLPSRHVWAKAVYTGQSTES